MHKTLSRFGWSQTSRGPRLESLPVTQEPAQPPVPSGRDRRPPIPLLVAAALVFLQALFTVVFGLSEVIHLTSGRVLMGATTALFFVAYGVALGFCAWGMRALRTWSRGPVLLAELIWLGLAWNLRHSSVGAVAVAVGISALVVLAGMLHPRSVEALNREEHRRR